MVETNITKETSLIDALCEQKNIDQHQEISQTEIQTWQTQNQEILNRHDKKFQQHQDILIRQQEEIENMKKVLYVKETNTT